MQPLVLSDRKSKEQKQRIIDRKQTLEHPIWLFEGPTQQPVFIYKFFERAEARRRQGFDIGVGKLKQT